MKNMYIFTLPILVILGLSGCKDKTYYMGSEYKQLHISKLMDIQGKGYRLNGGDYNTGNSWFLFFCKNNRYAYTSGAKGDKIYRGNYSVNLAYDSVVLTSDEVDSQGKKLHCTFNTESGYFEQEGKYLCKGGIYIGFNDLEQINSSSCDIDKEAFE